LISSIARFFSFVARSAPAYADLLSQREKKEFQMNLVQFNNPTGLYDPVPNGYSHAAWADTPGARLVLLSGQGGEDAEGRLADGFAAQVRRSLDNMLLALRAAGAQPQDVARTLVLVVDHDEGKLALLGREFDRIWPTGLKPACTLVPVPRLALDGMLVEIEATAVVRRA
jgi:enamine deaminase RidA (YjgF/YER057c/UK114 family)